MRPRICSTKACETRSMFSGCWKPALRVKSRRAAISRDTSASSMPEKNCTRVMKRPQKQAIWKSPAWTA
ncbi:hypothetical protein [Cystobacter fuscus]|uniref:hypothetical protein n=1 Tax=Cystobacter fuscus TaxID=43 RepID=UPI0005B9DA0A|nr:hypothetical protein [Cystobacter fuscus]